MYFSRNIKNNVFLFYIMRMFTLPFFWLPVIYIYLTRVKGLGTGETMFLLGLQELLMIFLEVPTGVVADKLSRKLSVGLGHILTCLPFVVFWISSNYWAFVGIFTVKAVGKALVSGADTSLLYDTLVDLGKTNEYKKILARSKFLTLSVVAACIFIGGLMADKYMEWTLVLPIPFMLIAAMSAFLMTEPETSKNAKKIQNKNYLIHIKESFVYILNSKELIMTGLIFSINEGLAVNMKWFYTPIYDVLNVNLATIGGITAMFYLGKSILNLISVKLIQSNSKKQIIVTMGIVSGLFLLIGLKFNLVFTTSALLGILLLNEMLEVLIEEKMQKNIESHNRATVMSALNLVSSIGATVMLVGFGFWQNNAGVISAIWWLSGLFFLGMMISLRLNKEPVR